MRAGERPPWAFALYCLAVALASAAAFVLPARGLTAPLWPVPLDDTYIYFAHARSWALGHPFAWMPGQGYSSGATSVVYPLLLAPLWALGLRGGSLALGALGLAVIFAVDAARSWARLCRGPWMRWVAPPLLLAVPLVGWSWWSGMEVALFGAVLGRALLASDRAMTSPPTLRGMAQLRAGLWLALLVSTRPEAVVLAGALAVAVVYRARSLPTAPSLGRSAGPFLGLLGLQAVTNRLLTGEWSPAGAVRKLLWNAPALTPAQGVARVVENLLVLVSQAFLRALGGAWVWLLLGAALALGLRRRRLVLPLVLGAFGGLLLVAQNATARFQNYRYAVPLLLMLLVAALLGLDALKRRRVALLLALVLLVAPWRELAGQRRHFLLASRNIAEQHGEIARRLAALKPRRILVNDAGAIPYLTGLPAVDGLGLGGFRRLPFARASTHSVLASVELIERLEPEARPDVMALYPGWWPGVADVFGRRLDAVTIEHNVICAAEEKVILAAEWSLLGPPRPHTPSAVDEVDVADLVSERAHALRPAHPVVAAVRELPDGRRRWDAGRRIPAGETLSFRVADDVEEGAAVLLLRTVSSGAVEVTTHREGQVVATAIGPPVVASERRWAERSIPVERLRGGDRIRIAAMGLDVEVFAARLLRLGHTFAP